MASETKNLRNYAVQFTSEQLGLLNSTASKTERSVSEIVRQAVDEYFQKEKKKGV